MGSALAHNDSRGIAQVIIVSVFLALCAVATGLRLWARKLKKTSLQFNDYSILVAFFFLCVFAASILMGNVIGGVGKHENLVSTTDIINLAKIFTSAEPLWAVSNTFVKLSILDLYQKIFRNRSFTLACYFMMVITICYLVMVVLETFLLCRPFAFNWDKSLNGHCANSQAAFLAAGIINLLVDVTVVALPLRPLWGLQMAISKKLKLTAIFTLGGFICIISIVRIISIQDLDTDFTFSVSLVGIWSFLEPALGVISACLPVMQPVLSKISDTTINLWTKSFGSKTLGSKSHTWGHASASTERIEAGPQKFQRLQDTPIALTNLESGSYANKIGPSSVASSKGDEGPGENHIQVRSDWAVHIDHV